MMMATRNLMKPSDGQPIVGPSKDMVLGVYYICLLYTSDAADERSSVDLGGRRIIKKKNNAKQYRRRQD